MASIHPSAVVSPAARIGRNVSVGPFCVVEEGAVIGDNCKLASRVVIKSGTTLAADNQLAEGAVLGGRPQHLRAGDQIGRLLIGRGNQFREHVTVHRGLTPNDQTRVGENNLVMVGAHIAHDCQVGSHTIIANNVMLAGHVTVGDHAYLSGAVGVHQFCRIGQYAMVGGQAHVNQDVPPYVTVDGLSSLIVGLNLVGLRRGGFSDHQIRQLKAAYRIVYRSGMTWSETLAALKDQFPEGPAAEFLPFLSASRRGFVRERRTPRAAILPLPATPTAPERAAELRKTG